MTEEATESQRNLSAGRFNTIPTRLQHPSLTLASKPSH